MTLNAASPQLIKINFKSEFITPNKLNQADFHLHHHHHHHLNFIHCAIRIHVFVCGGGGGGALGGCMVTVNRLSSSRFLHGPDVKRILPFLSPLRLDKSDHHGPVPAVLH